MENEERPEKEEGGKTTVDEERREIGVGLCERRLRVSGFTNGETYWIVLLFSLRDTRKSRRQF